MKTKLVDADFAHLAKSRVVWMLLTFISTFGALNFILDSFILSLGNRTGDVQSKPTQSIDSSPTLIPESDRLRETRNINWEAWETRSNINGTPAMEPLRIDSSSPGPAVLPSIPPTNSSVEADKNVTLSQSRTSNGFYIYSRPDRSGATIYGMLEAHAFSYFNNRPLLGTCFSRSEDDPKFYFKTNHERLITAIGLDNELRFECPVNNESQFLQISFIQNNPTGGIVRPEYLQYLRSKAKYPTNTTRGAVIHIRRGDINPCIRGGRSNFRYLPNLYYKLVIEKYIPPGINITIYSEHRSFEPWTDWSNFSRSIDLKIDTDITGVWQHMMTADFLVMSKSSFSVIPAMLNRHGKVIHTSFWHRPVDGWIAVSQDILNQTQLELSRLQRLYKNGTQCQSRAL